jgi:hypothetical protein
MRTVRLALFVCFKLKIQKCQSQPLSFGTAISGQRALPERWMMELLHKRIRSLKKGGHNHED